MSLDFRVTHRLAAALLFAFTALLPVPVLAQTVSTVAISSTPAEGQSQRYKIGDAVQATVTFSEAVDVTGTPQLEIDVGGSPKTLNFSSGSTTATLVFTGYTVLEGDEDTDGISIDADSVTLNGGTIKKKDNTDNATITHNAVAADAGQLVDGVKPYLIPGGGVTPGLADYNIPTNMVFATSEDLDSLSVPPTSAFTVKVSAGETPTVDVVEIFGPGVSIDLSSDVDATAHVQLSYTQPTGTNATPIRDLAGNPLDDFTDQTIGNFLIRAETVTGVSVTPGPGALMVSWNVARNADGYEVNWETEDSDDDDEELNTYKDRRAFISGGNTTHYTIQGLIPGTRYLVYVLGTRTYGLETGAEGVLGTPLNARVSSIELTSDPGPVGYYVEGDVIEATVTFNGPVDIAGVVDPNLFIGVGGFSNRGAECPRGTGVTKTVCRYPVAANDNDVDGVEIPGDPFLLRQNTTIRLAGTEYDAVLTHPYIPADPGHKVDTTAPTYVSGETSNTGATIVLTFSETLWTTTATPDAFEVQVNTVVRNVTSVAVNGTELTLTLASAVANGETVTVGYTDPGTGDDLRAVQDLAGNDAVGFSGQTVTNNVPATAVTVPDAPTKPDLTVEGPRTIQVDWTAPADNGNSITGYRIEYSSDGSGWTDLEPDTGSTEISYLDETIRPGSTRYYRISAINGNGAGLASPSAHAQTNGGVWISNAPTSVKEGEEIVFELEQTRMTNYEVGVIRVEGSGGVIEDVRLRKSWRRNHFWLPFWHSDLGSLPRQTVRVKTRTNGKLGEGGTVTLTLYCRPSEFYGFYCVEPYSVSVTVTDNEPPGLFIDDAEANESDGTMAFQVRLERQYQDTVTVDYATADLTAEAGPDYTETEGTLTFTGSQTEKTVSVPILADSANDDGETFRLLLSNPSAGVKINDGEAFGTIRDASSPTGLLAGVNLIDAASGTDLGRIVTFVRGFRANSIELTLPDPHGIYEIRAVPTPGADIGSVSLELFNEPKNVVSINNEAPYELFAGAGQTLPPGSYGVQIEVYAEDDAKGDQLEGRDFAFDVAEIDPVAAGTALSGLSLESKRGGTSQSIEHGEDENGDPVYPVFERAQGERFEISAEVDEEIGSVHLELWGRTTAARTDNEAPYELFGGSGNALPPGIYTVQAIVYGNENRGGSVLQTLTRTFTLGVPTATFEKVPDEHVGDAFSFRIQFNEDATVSDAALKAALHATGGTVTSVGRVSGRADLRYVWVQPDDDVTDVALSLPATTDCAAAGAVCMSDGRMLSNASDETVVAAVQMSVSDATATETSGATAVFTVSLNQPSDVEVTVDYTTKEGTAKTGGLATKGLDDYTPTNGTLTFAVDSMTNETPTTMTVSVPILTDSFPDDGEDFWLVLSNASGARMEDGAPTRESLGYDDPGSGRGTIRETGNSSVLSVHDDGATEGRHGALLFPVLLSPAWTAEVTVDYATADGDALDGDDYHATSGTLTFEPGNTLMYVRVPIINDDDPDSGETLTLTLSNPTGATLHSTDHTATGTIWNTEATVLSVADAAASEDAGVLVFAVTLNQAEDTTVTVDYVTLDGTATAGDDYTETSGTLTFAAGETLRTVSVPVTADDAEEADETLSLVLSNASGAGIADAAATGTIRNTQPLTLSVADAEVREGTDATLDFPITLSRAAANEITVHYKTIDGTATAGTDYTAVNASVVFAAGEVEKTVAVAVLADTVIEGSETVKFWLDAVHGMATEQVTDAHAVGTILPPEDDVDPLQTFTLVNATTDTNVGTIAAGGTFTLDDPANGSYGIVVDTATGAEIGSVQLALSGALTVTQTENLAPYSLYGDTDGQAHGAGLPAGSYTVSATAYEEANLGGATLQTLTVAFSVVAASVDDEAADDTPLPTLSVADAAATEEVDTSLSFEVTLDAASAGTVTVDYATSDATATTPADYAQTSGTLTFAAGDTSKTVVVAIVDDTAVDSDETLTLTLSNPSGATLADATATGTITDSDLPPLTASFSQVPDEHDGASEFSFRVLFSEAIPTSYTVLRDDDAFKVTGGTVEKARRVNGRDDLREIHIEPTGHAAITIELPPTTDCDAKGAICMGADDGRKLSVGDSATVTGPPGLSVADAEGTEADGTVDFTVTLTRASQRRVTVDYATTDDSAHAGHDYEAAEGTLTLAAGTTTGTVSVTVLNDQHDDDDERFRLVLSNPSGAWLKDGEAIGKIRNNDPLPKAWLVRFGRSATDHVLDAITARFDEPVSGSHADLGGLFQVGGSSPFSNHRVSRIDAGNSPRGFGIRDSGVFTKTPGLGSTHSSYGGGFSFVGQTPGTLASRTTTSEMINLKETGGQWSIDGYGDPQDRQGRTSSRAPSPMLSDLLLRSSFRTTSDELDGGRLFTTWGRAVTSRFDGIDDGVAVDGDVATYMLGADAHMGRWLTGITLAHSLGTGSFRGDAGTSDLNAELTALHPYARYELSERTSAWGVTGFGVGALTLNTPLDETMQTDTSMYMGAAGLRGVFVRRANGLELAVRADARLTDIASEAIQRKPGNLAATVGTTNRTRLLLEGSHRFELVGNHVFMPRLEIGVRRDGGDVETGAGIDVGGSFAYTNASSGLSVETAARMLLAHADDAYREWGASTSVRFDPGKASHGLSLSLTPSWGAEATRGVERLWSLRDPRVLTSRSTRNTGRRVTADVGYGLPAFRHRGSMTPYAGVQSSAFGRDWRAGVRWRLDTRLEIELEATQRPLTLGTEDAFRLRWIWRLGDRRSVNEATLK